MPIRASHALPAGFARLAWSNLAAQSAEQVGLAAAPIVAVTALGAGVAATGLLQAAQTLPFLLLAIPAGVLADRVSRRRLMALAELVRALSLAAIACLAGAGALGLPALALLGCLGAAGTVVFSVAAPSLVPSLVPAAALAAANGRIELARSAAFTAGPALGGLLVGWTGALPAFVLAAAMSATAVATLTRVREPPRAPVPRRHPWAELREGARFVLGEPLLRPVVVTAFVFNASFFALQAGYVPHAVRDMGLSAAGVGATLAAYGAGMVVAAALAGRIARRLAFGTVIAIGPLCGLAAGLAMLATVWVPSPALAGLSFLLMGSGPLLWVISTTTLRQAVTPDRLLGRVSAIVVTATWGARPLGSAIGALAGAVGGPRFCLAVAAAGFLVQAVVVLVSPLPRLARQPGLAG